MEAGPTVIAYVIPQELGRIRKAINETLRSMDTK